MSDQHLTKAKELLNEIVLSYQEILKNNLVGIYVHGSLAFGCFNWDKSDIDFLVVTNSVPSQDEKVLMIQKLLDLLPISPPKGLEMSLILEKYCKQFVYPTPYELHYSNDHLASIKKSINEYCQNMHGIDKDLAAHFTITKAVGLTLCGQKIDQVFTSDVPKSDYLDSILLDTENFKDEIKSVIKNHDNQSFVYIVLNLCRVLAFVREDLVISKEKGGLWGLKNLPQKFEPVVNAALKIYKSNQEDIWPDNSIIEEFVQFMTNQIFSK